jgi:DNA-binding CsgD family transcriptional regulator
VGYPKPQNTTNVRIALPAIPGHHKHKKVNLVTDDEKRKMVNALLRSENELYVWLRDAYSYAWIAETLLMEERDVKRNAERVYLKLGVADQRELIRVYGALDKKTPDDKEAAAFSAEELSNALTYYQENRA